MSDTPRMDSAAGHARGIVDAAILAEGIKLERELNVANDRINLLKSTGDELLEWLKDGAISDSNYRLLANAWQRAKENKP